MQEGLWESFCEATQTKEQIKNNIKAAFGILIIKGQGGIDVSQLYCTVLQLLHKAVMPAPHKA